MRANAALLLRGMRWRLGTSLLTVLTSTIAVGAAVLGPLYLHTAGDSVVRSIVKASVVDASGATLSSPPGQVATLGQVQRAEGTVQDVGGTHRFYGAPITTVVSGVTLAGPGIALPVPAAVTDWDLRRAAVRPGGLQHRPRRCRAQPAERPGARCLDGRRDQRRRNRAAGARSGSRVDRDFAVPNLTSPYWWGGGARILRLRARREPRSRARPVRHFDRAPRSPSRCRIVPAMEGQVPLKAAAVGLADQSYLQRALASAQATLAARGVVLSTELPQILSQRGPAAARNVDDRGDRLGAAGAARGVDPRQPAGAKHRSAPGRDAGGSTAGVPAAEPAGGDHRRAADPLSARASRWASRSHGARSSSPDTGCSIRPR